MLSARLPVQLLRPNDGGWNEACCPDRSAHVVVAASTASADMYGSLRLANVLNMKEFALGTQSESLGLEVAVGYTKATLTDLENIGMDEFEDLSDPGITLMSLGAAVFFTMTENSQYAFDIGARAQYLSMSIDAELPEIELSSDDEMSLTASALTFGPVLRGRWYLADGAMAIGPEIYPRFQMWSTEAEMGGDSSDGPGMNIIDLEYSLRMEFYF